MRSPLKRSPSAALAILVGHFCDAVAAFAPLTTATRGKPWFPAAATAHERDTNRLGWSPRPTAAPAPGPWGEMELLKRQSEMGTDTCGFLSGYSSVAVTCVKESAYCTDDGRGNRDCCTGEYSDCTSSMFSACLDFSASEKGACSGKGPRTLCCWAASPSCYTLIFSTSASPDKAFSLYQCDSTAGLGYLLATPPAFARTSSITSSTRTSSSTTSSAESTTSKIPPSGGGADGSSSAAPIGAIVGGVVGGVAVLGLFAFFITWYLIRSRHDQNNPQRPPPPSTTALSPQSSYMSGYQSLPQQVPSPYKPYDAFHVQQTAQPYDPALPHGHYSPPEQQPAAYPPATTITELPAAVGLGTADRRAELD